MAMNLNTYLTFNGNCEAAFNFYKSVFGGEFVALQRFKEMPSGPPLSEAEKEMIMHMVLPIGNTVLFGSDKIEAFGKAKVGDNFSLNISADSEAQARRIFDALGVGGKVQMPLEKAFWGALFGSCTDKFDIQWIVHCETP